MAFPANIKGFSPKGGDPNKTGDLSAAAAASAASVKPTRRTARGSDIAKQQKQALKDQRTRDVHASKARTEARQARMAAREREVASPVAAWTDKTSTVASAFSARPQSSRFVAQEHASQTHVHPARYSAQAKAAKAADRAHASHTSKRSSAQNKVQKPGVFGAAFAGAFGAIAGFFGRLAAPNSPNTKESQQAFLKYANDNAVVRAVYNITTGSSRHIFYAFIIALVAVGVYLPVRDFYIANRTAQILQEQKAIRDKYNDLVGKEVKSYMSEEGISDTARKDLNMVMPGEQTITVQGLDENGNPVVVDPNATSNQSGDSNAAEGANGKAGEGKTTEGKSEGSGADAKDNGVNSKDANGKDGAEGAPRSTTGAAGVEEDNGRLKGADAANKNKTGSNAAKYDPTKEPTTSAEVEAAERAVLENSAWYWKVLDVIFFFDGANGMAVVSTGE